MDCLNDFMDDQTWDGVSDGFGVGMGIVQHLQVRTSIIARSSAMALANHW